LHTGRGWCIYKCMARNAMHLEIISFQAYDDASGAPAVVEVRQGRQAARFALDMLGGVEPTCNGLESGLTANGTRLAANAARRLYYAHLKATKGDEWISRNAALYEEA
jgi:hypothetical protein